jgi:hypothetical protein
MELGHALKRALGLSAIVILFASTAETQQFQILRAEYGDGDQWVDVTPHLRELLRARGTFRVGNESLEVDPVVGRTKTLRIEVRTPRGDTGTYQFREGSVVDSAQFVDATVRDSIVRSVDTGPRDGRLQIVRAEYGIPTRSVDVTARVRELLHVHPTFRVANDLLGIDPVRGREKTLRVEVRDVRGGERLLEYHEGELVDGRLFSASRSDDGYQGTSGAFSPHVRIVSAVYGAGDRNMDVSARLQSMVDNGSLNVIVNNLVLEVDPAPGSRKTLKVTYSVDGGSQRRAVVGEGELLRLP